MPDRPTADTLAQAWHPALLRRLGRACNDLAIAELCRESGRVRAADFLPRTRRLLRSTFTPAGAPEWMRQLAAASLHQSHPCTMAQQICAPVPLAVLAEPLISALNQSIAVWEMSPAGTLLDRALIHRFKKLLGYPASAEGSLTPGGSFANLTALQAARAALAPRAWQHGQRAAGRIAILAGAHTHYSVARAAGLLGLGTDCVFSLPLDPLYRTDAAAIPAAAARARRAGYRRLLLVASSGSTPTGSFDDLTSFAAAARRLRAQPDARVWWHVDAAHGGGMAFSARARRLLRGISGADSIAFDPHKMMFMPLAAGAVLVREGARLHGAFEQHAPYLFSPVRRAVADVGPFTLACSQRFEALKIWLVWQAYGPRFFAALSDAVCSAAAAGYAYCEGSKLLAPAHRPQANIFCFGLRQPPPSGPAADALHWKITQAVNASGRAYLSSTVLAGRRCFRMVVMNPRTRPAHVERVLRLAERTAVRLRGKSR
ncbi:MAG: pyridoxal phosphate-dependent decarboxylase family protein [Terriglobales bacterium]